jgi:hypothetical protein
MDYLALATDLARAQAPATYDELTADNQLRACGAAVDASDWYESAAYEAVGCSERSLPLLAKAFDPQVSDAEVGRYFRDLMRDYLGGCAEHRGDELAERVS